MKLFKLLLPMFTFVAIYLFSGFYFYFNNISNAFYQLSPNIAIIPAIILAWLITTGNNQTKMENFIRGASQKDITTMCMIFLFSGAFSYVTMKIGSVDATVDLALSLFPSNSLLIALFLTSSFISTSIGSSMGTIATMVPIAVGLSSKGAFEKDLAIGIVISGAMFGDNLSMISDTTIAATNSQGTDPKNKLKFNAKLSLIAAILTIILILFCNTKKIETPNINHTMILILPYIFIVVLAISGINVFIVLVTALIFSGIIGILVNNYDIISFCKDISIGFQNNYDIMALSLFIGGLSGLMNDSFSKLMDSINFLLPKKNARKIGFLLIAKIVSILNILLANNTISILFCGRIAKEISNRYELESHKTAAILDIFACVIQGIIPYGAQVLLAGSLASLSPFQIITKVYYCYFLGIVSLIYLKYEKQKMFN